MDKKKEALVQQYKKKKSAALKEKVVVAYTPLIQYIARKLSYRYYDLQDLVQVGTIGLLKSLEGFDPSKEIAFSTFASANIIGEIKHYLRDKSRLMKLPRKLQEQFSKIRQHIKVASQKKGKSPTIQEIATALELREDEVLEALEAGQITHVVSLDKPMYTSSPNNSSQEQASLLDSIGIEFRDEKVLNKETLKQALHKLSDRSKKIIYLRFYEGRTQKEIANEMNLSQMHISRLIDISITKLKKTITKKHDK